MYEPTAEDIAKFTPLLKLMNAKFEALPEDSLARKMYAKFAARGGDGQLRG